MAIFVTGDTHGGEPTSIRDGFIHRLAKASFPEQTEMTKDDVVIICGDFGGIWHTDRNHCIESKQEIYALDWLEDKPFTTVFVPGNHENYDRLTGLQDETMLNNWLFSKYSETDKQRLTSGYPTKCWNGGTVRAIRPSVLMLESGVFNIQGKTCFCYGGAPSHDIQDGILDPTAFPTEKQFKAVYKQWAQQNKNFRVRSVSWWPQEQPDFHAEETAIAALETHNNQVDFILTHDCSTSTRVLIGKPEITRINVFLETIKQTVIFRHWFFGHFHMNIDVPGGTEHCLYEQLIQIA